MSTSSTAPQSALSSPEPEREGSWFICLAYFIYDIVCYVNYGNHAYRSFMLLVDWFKLSIVYVMCLANKPAKTYTTKKKGIDERGADIFQRLLYPFVFFRDSTRITFAEILQRDFSSNKTLGVKTSQTRWDEKTTQTFSYSFLK